MLFWCLWLDWLSLCAKPVTVQVTLPQATVYDFAAEKAKRRHG